MTEETMPVCIVGSGPAAVAAAHALVSQGVEVTMLDVGLDLEPERARLLDDLAAGTPETWDAATLAKLKAGMLATTGGIPEKLTYGSDFPFRDVGQAGKVERRGADALISAALGGLSNAWGSNLMTYAKHDIDDWCISSEELAPHYRAVSSFIPVSGRIDDLAEFFPFHGQDGVMVHPSQQAQSLMRTLTSNRAALRAAGMSAGYSRLAVQAEPAVDNSHGCVHCGLCLYGCPYRLIYSSRSTVQQLRRRSNFRYLKGVIVKRVIEHSAHVEIDAQSVESGEAVHFSARRVYLACGAVSTTRILLASMPAAASPVVMKDSQFFLFPMLHYDCVPGVMQERLHTLGQVYLEVMDRALSPRTIQLQVYTYNDLFDAALRDKLKFLHPLAKPFLPSFFGRMSIVMGYLHSDDSAGLKIGLDRDEGGGTLRIEAIPSDRPAKVIDGVMRKLWRNRSLLRAIPLRPMLEIFKPGKSYHYGCTFPMREAPGTGESDRWGRPFGFKRVHVVDASVLPSVAATSIVFTAMANAHRIASGYSAME